MQRPQQQQHPQQVPQPQQSPGSSWHTPQGMNMTPVSSQPMSAGQDNSFKIRIPGMMGGSPPVQTKPDPDIIDLDLDGAPIIIPSNTSSLSSSSLISTNNNPNQVNHSNSVTTTPVSR